jgi:hypothetical protein
VQPCFHPPRNQSHHVSLPPRKKANQTLASSGNRRSTRQTGAAGAPASSPVGRSSSRTNKAIAPPTAVDEEDEDQEDQLEKCPESVAVAPGSGGVGSEARLEADKGVLQEGGSSGSSSGEEGATEVLKLLSSPQKGGEAGEEAVVGQDEVDQLEDDDPAQHVEEAGSAQQPTKPTARPRPSRLQTRRPSKKKASAPLPVKFLSSESHSPSPSASPIDLNPTPQPPWSDTKGKRRRSSSSGSDLDSDSDDPDRPDNEERPKIFMHARAKGGWSSDKIWLYPTFDSAEERERLVYMIQVHFRPLLVQSSRDADSFRAIGQRRQDCRGRLTSRAGHLPSRRPRIISSRGDESQSTRSAFRPHAPFFNPAPSDPLTFIHRRHARRTNLDPRVHQCEPEDGLCVAVPSQARRDHAA